MKETRIFLDITHHDNGDINFYVGGGECNDGTGEFHNSLADAIKDLSERTVVEYNLMLNSVTEKER